MYIHLGNNAIVKTEEIIGIFDLDNTTVSARTRDFLKKAQNSGNVILTGTDLPKSFIVAATKKGENKVFISQLSPATLNRRKGY
jgi:hypothetical protein